MPSIYKRNKVWYIDYRIDGKRERKRIGSSKKVAELELKNIEVKLSRGEIEPPTKKKSLHEFFDELEKYIEINKKHNTKVRYLEVLDHFKEFLKDYPSITHLTHINSRIMEHYKQARTEHVAHKTVNFEIGTIGHFFNLAIKYNYISKNPVEDVEKLKWKQKTPKFFSKKEIKLILENCGERLYPIFLAFLYTGMRKNELKNLEWTDIDFKNKLIKVQIKDFWEPKFGSARLIPMNRKLCEILGKHDRKSRWVFCTNSGQQVRHLRRDLLLLCDRLGIKNVTLHTFRHTFASHLVMSGVDLPSVQKLLGHKDIKTTMIYAHLAPDHLKRAVEKIKF